MLSIARIACAHVMLVLRVAADRTGSSDSYRTAISECGVLQNSNGDTLEVLAAGSISPPSSACLWLTSIEGRRVLH